MLVQMFESSMAGLTLRFGGIDAFFWLDFTVGCFRRVGGIFQSDNVPLESLKS